MIYVLSLLMLFQAVYTLYIMYKLYKSVKDMKNGKTTFFNGRYYIIYVARIGEMYMTEYGPTTSCMKEAIWYKSLDDALHVSEDVEAYAIRPKLSIWDKIALATVGQIVKVFIWYLDAAPKHIKGI